MAANSDGVKASAQRVWPNTKRIDLAPGSSGMISPTGSDPRGYRVLAIDVNDDVIGHASADTLEALKSRLDDMAPQGGQAP